MRLNAAPVGAWVGVRKGSGRSGGSDPEIGPASDGAFDIGMGDAVIASMLGRQPRLRSVFARR